MSCGRAIVVPHVQCKVTLHYHDNTQRRLKIGCIDEFLVKRLSEATEY